MAEDWKSQLQSQDPRKRVEAIKAIANSGDRANLPFLKDIVDNDPDPRLQDYARKAARHLFTSTEEAAPKKTPAREEVKPVPEKQPRSPEPEEVPPAERTAAEAKIQRALSLHMQGNTQKALKAFIQGLDRDPDLANETFTRSVAAELTEMDSDQAIAILLDPEERKELLNPSKDASPKPAQKPERGKSPEGKVPRSPGSGLIQTWLSFFSMSEEFLAEEADQANTEDTLISILVFTIAAVVIFMITGFVQFPQFIEQWNMLVAEMAEMGESLPPLDLNFGMIFFGLLIGTLIMTPISFFIGSGIQFLGARIFGGSGDFKTHLFILSIIQVPVTVLGGVTSIIAFIPWIGFVASLAGFGLSIFTLIVTVRAFKAVHSLPTGRAIAGMILFPIILVVVVGCLLTIFGSALIGMLAGMG